MIEHSRIVYNLMDWLGDIGGINEILQIIFMFAIGGFLNFNISMQSLIKHECGDNQNEGGE